MKKKHFWSGISAGLLVCMTSHLIAALFPIYVGFPMVNSLFGENVGPFAHIVKDLVSLLTILVPVALLTILGHTLIGYVKCKCGTVHENDPCRDCKHRKH